MSFGNQRAGGGGLIHRPSDAQRFGLLLQRGHEAIHEFALDVHAFGAETDLAGIQEDGVGDAIHRFVEIAVGKNDGRVFAAQFKGDWLHGGSDGVHDGRAGARFAGESDRVHSRDAR